MKTRSPIYYLGILLMTILTLLCGDLGVKAQEIVNKSMALVDLLQEAKEQNPDIISAKHKWQSAEEIVEAQRAFPDPQISYTYYVESVETRVGPMRNVFGAKQKLPK